jgi:hypothetical protein
VRSRQRQEVKPGRDTHEKAPQDRSKEKKGPGRGR